MTTIQQIAKQAGVSVATVSHVVNRTRYVSPELVKKVEEVIESLDDVPNFIAKKRKINSRDIAKKILVYITNPHNNFQVGIISSIIDALSDTENTNIVTIHTNDIFSTIKNYSIVDSEDYLGQIVLVDENISSELKFNTSTKMLPSVIIGEEKLDSVKTNLNNIKVIISDGYNGIYEAITHLANNGHEKIAIVTGSSLDKNNDFLKAYNDSLTAKSITISKEYIYGHQQKTEISNYMRKLFYEFDPPTALFVTNEHDLVEILRFMSKHNLTCPEDISIICFNDSKWFELFSPAITSVKQKTDYIGKKALELLGYNLFSNNNEYESISERLLVPTQLKLRSSTGGIGRGPFGEKASNIDKIQLSEEEKLEIKKQKFTAAISFHYTGAAWMYLHEQGIKNIFNELGISLLAITDAHFDPDMQNRQLESLMALDPDIVIAIPSEDNKTSNTFKKIANSRAKLVLITNVPKGLTPNDYVSCVSVNEWSHGRIAISGLGDSMIKDNKKNIGLVLFDSDFYATNQRDAAARQMIKEEYSELNIVGETKFKDESEVFERTVALLKHHPEIEGLYISWEGPATKSLDAIHYLGRSDILIGTADLDYSLALNMAKGENVKAVSAQLPYEQGQALGIVAANALLDKQVPKFIGVEPIKVSRENLMKNWKKIFKENPPNQIVEPFKSNPEE